MRCQRCERPTCPECQRQAPVGVQCVDCVSAGARQVPERRTVFGGLVRPGRPVVTLTLIGLCVVTYLLQGVSGGAGSGLVTQLLVFYPPLGALQPWRFLTAAFLHGSLFHIALNMYVLYLTGPYLEQALGRWRFTVLYLVSALGGSVGYLLLYRPGDPGTVGASGAVFGLFAAMLVLQRRMRLPLRQTAVVIGINAVLGFLIPGIAWQAHLGGLVTGAAVAAVMAFAPAPRDAGGAQRRTALQIGGSVLVTAVLAGAAVLGLGLIGAPGSIGAS